MDIFTELRGAADPVKAAAMSAYMRNLFPFLGIQTPERNKLCRNFLKTMAKQDVDWEFVFKCWEQPEREFQYLAVGYLSETMLKLSSADIPKIRLLAVEKSWWDTIDSLSGVVGDIALRFSDVNFTLIEWSRDENFWLRRISIIHQLGRKEKTDTALLKNVIKANFGQTEFFINKAIGWSLREYSKTNPAWVRDFINQYQKELNPLSIREASKYITHGDGSFVSIVSGVE